MKNLITYSEKIIEYLMAASLAIMFLAVLINVILRYFFGSGIAASEELSRLLFVWLIFLGATLAVGRNLHISFDLIQRHLSSRIRTLCAIISHCLMIYALFLFAQGSWNQSLIGLHITSTVMKYPLALMSSAGVFASIGMGFYIIKNLVYILCNSNKAIVPGTSYIISEQNKENN